MHRILLKVISLLLCQGLSFKAMAKVNISGIAAATTIAVNLLDIGGTVRKMKKAGKAVGKTTKKAAKKIAGK